MRKRRPRAHGRRRGGFNAEGLQRSFHGRCAHAVLRQILHQRACLAPAARQPFLQQRALRAFKAQATAPMVVLLHQRLAALKLGDILHRRKLQRRLRLGDKEAKREARSRAHMLSRALRCGVKLG